MVVGSVRDGQMDITIERTRGLSGSIKAPGSKSYTHRVLVAATLNGETRITNPSNSEANRAMVRACRALGAKIVEEGNEWIVTGTNGEPKIMEQEIDVGNSGTALRLAIALASLAKHGTVIISGDPSLRSRPTRHLIDALNDMGANIEGSEECKGRAPITIKACGLKGGEVNLDITKSSQYLSSLLLVSTFAEKDVTINIKGKIVSKPYIDMTLENLKDFGVRVNMSGYRKYNIVAGQKFSGRYEYHIPGDYSQAAFPLAAGCLVGSNITVTGLQEDNQGDKKIISVLSKMGANVSFNKDHATVAGPAVLQGIDCDLLDTPDLFPVLSVMGMYAEGKTRLYNMPQIREKETDRIYVMSRELRKCGAVVDTHPDEMTVYHKDVEERHYEFDARGGHGVADHRVAMALSLIGMKSGPATITGADKISISYPDYFRDMKLIGAQISVPPIRAA